MAYSKPWVIFDADNTLWSVESLYDCAREALCDYLATRGVSAISVREFQHARDVQLKETYGYSACRYARSFEDTILNFVPDADSRDVRHVRKLALDVFEQRAEMNDGLDNVVQSLTSYYHLGIITAGERWVQERRLNDFHLRENFAAVEIVEAKDASVFQAFASAHGVDRPRSWVLGDSVHSDIVPALAAGLRPVLFDTHNWSRAEGSLRDLPEGIPVITQLNDFLEIPGVIPDD